MPLSTISVQKDSRMKKTIYSISDNSFALVPTLNYSLSDNVEVFAYLNINFGKEGKVFAKNMGNGGMIRARVYF